MSLQGHHLEGALTAGLILAPGLASCCLELREMWRGRGSCLLAGLYLLLCPLWVLLTHLYSIFNPRWQSKALMLKSMEGFLCAAPQLVLQLALWLRGSLTSPLQMVLSDHLDVQLATSEPEAVAEAVNNSVQVKDMAGAAGNNETFLDIWPRLHQLRAIHVWSGSTRQHLDQFHLAPLLSDSLQ